MMGRATLRLLAALAVLGATPAFAQDPGTGARVTLKDAEARAVQNHPQLRASQYEALAATETVREARSAYFPTVVGSITGAEAQEGSRIAAGALNNPLILDRLAYGFTAAQLLTDFGRTPALVASAALRAGARQQDVTARRASVLLAVDSAYFDALRAQAILRVAEETVTARQVAVDQVSALASAGLKSALDLSFSKVALSEAQLLLIQARNDLNGAYAILAAALGTPETTAYELVDEPMPGPPAAESGPLVAAALRDRPDVAAARFGQQSAAKFADAERGLWFPTLSMAAAAGLTPYHQTGLTSEYSAVGINLAVPLTNGHLFSARHAEAALHASAAEQAVHDLENRVARDVQLAWLDARTSYQRLDLTNQLLSQAADALELAQQRYTLGLSSIVELTQAQLNQTRAQIEQATAKYEFQRRSAALRYQLGALK